MKKAALTLGTAMALAIPGYTLAGTETIGITGEQAPGVPIGANFWTFYAPMLNHAGQVAYGGRLNIFEGGGVGGTNDLAYWLDEILIAREGSQAGGTQNGAVFNSFYNFVLNDAGQMAYPGYLRTGEGGVDSTNDHGLWLDDALIVREGEHAAGTGAVFESFSPPALNNAGQIAYFGTLRTGTAEVNSNNDTGIWRDQNLIAREGSQAHGTPVGTTFGDFTNLTLNDLGQTAYAASLRNDANGMGGVDYSNNNGIWRDSTLIAREGSQAGGVPDGAVFFGLPNNYRNPRLVLNNSGQIAFHASLQIGRGGVESTNNIGIWLDSTLIAREGSQAGGVPDGAVFEYFLELTLNDAGQTAYVGHLQQGVGGVENINDEGIWRDSTLVVRANSQSPGTPEGTVFSFFNTVEINDTGQIAFEGAVRGEGVDTTNNDGIWIAGTNGELLKVVREDDTLEGRSFHSFRFSEDTDGPIDRGRAFNNFSQVAYSAYFSNGDYGNFLYTPDLHWNSESSGHWDEAQSWTIGQLPGDPHDVYIDPTTSLTVTGPVANVTLTNLSIGGNAGIATLTLGTGTITANNSVTLLPNGVLNGNGIIDGHLDAHDGSVVAPGLSHGHLTAGSFTLRSGATLAVELGGTAQASEHDLLEIMGEAVLAGTLDVQLIDGFDPDLGDTFVILNFASSTGTFADVLLPTLDTGLGWHLGRLYADGELHVELEGDVNLDGIVDNADFIFVLEHRGDSTLVFDYAAGDVSGDGLVDDTDLAIVWANFGNVPEPGSATMLGLCSIALLRRRR